MAFYFFMAKSYSILCIYDFFIHSSVHVHFSYFCVSAVNAAAVHACGHSCCCSVSTSILQNGDCPHEMLNPLSPPSGCTQHPAFCEYGADCSRGLYEWTQTSFVLPCLPYVNEHNVFRVHPCCSLSELPSFQAGQHSLRGWTMVCLSILLLRDTWNIYIHLSHLVIFVELTSESPMNQKSFIISYVINLLF